MIMKIQGRCAMMVSFRCNDDDGGKIEEHNCMLRASVSLLTPLNRMPSATALLSDRPFSAHLMKPPSLLDSDFSEWLRENPGGS